MSYSLSYLTTCQPVRELHFHLSEPKTGSSLHFTSFLLHQCQLHCAFLFERVNFSPSLYSTSLQTTSTHTLIYHALQLFSIHISKLYHSICRYDFISINTAYTISYTASTAHFYRNYKNPTQFTYYIQQLTLYLKENLHFFLSTAKDSLLSSLLFIIHMIGALCYSFKKAIIGRTTQPRKEVHFLKQ